MSQLVRKPDLEQEILENKKSPRKTTIARQHQYLDWDVEEEVIRALDSGRI